jgi:hypothetical protein
MKDFDHQKNDAPTDPASPIMKSHGQTARGSGDAPHVASDLASHSGPDADALRSPELSHPANAAPLADLLGQLQHSHGNIYVQRVVADLNEAKSGTGSQSTTQGLDAGTRSEMESAFGENFGDVRVHTDADAERLNTELGARAVTRGRDIYFAAGEYNPATAAGKHLVAHELTHVIQQEGGSARDQGHSIGAVGDPFEREAARAAVLAVRGEHVHVEKRGAAAPACQLDQRGAQAAPPQPAPSSEGTATTSVDVTAAPSGRLPNGVIYNYSGSSEQDLANHFFWLSMPSGMTLQLATQETQGALVTTDGEKKVVFVQARPGQNPRVEITFTEGKKRTVVTFILPRRAAAPPQPHRR